MPDAPDPPVGPAGSRRVQLLVTPAAAATLVAAAGLVVVGRNVVVDAHRPMAWAVACAIVALLLDPVIAALDRHLPRVLSIVVTVAGIAAVAALLSVSVLHELDRSADALRQSAPDAAAGLEERSELARDFRVAERVDDFVATLDERVEGDAVGRAVGTVPTYVVTGILMLFLLAYGRRFANGALGQIRDTDRRLRARIVLRRAVQRGRGYLLATLAQVFTVTALAWVVFRALDLPAALVLALITGAASAVPYLGIVLGGLPALLIAAGLEGAWAAVAVAVALVVLQVVEAAVVRQWVDPRTVHVGPALPIIVVLVGFELYGVGGAVYGAALLVLTLAALDAFAELRGEEALEVP